MDQSQKNNVRSRWAIGSFFFLHGLCFSSWGARIPAIQQNLNLSEVELGSVLFALPIGSLFSMPLAAWLVGKYGSRKVASVAVVCYASLLICLGLASSVWILAGCLVGFGTLSNMVNVSVNTQAVQIETVLKKSVMASLHGLWSLAGFTGAAIGAVMIGFGIAPPLHFLAVALLVAMGALLNFKSLLPDPPAVSTEEKPPLFALPDKALMGLGLIAFFSMICEGTMFDWSGVYFKKVIMADPAWVGAGYTAFMSTMAGARFLADRFVGVFGIRRILKASGITIAVGLMISVIQPTMVMGIIGFLLVGAGTSAVVPLVFSEAGKTSSLSTSSSIAAVSTIGFLGFLIGPPLIGWIAGVTSLRVSFSLIALMGLGIYFVAAKQYRKQTN